MARPYYGPTPNALVTLRDAEKDAEIARLRQQLAATQLERNDARYIPLSAHSAGPSRRDSPDSPVSVHSASVAGRARREEESWGYGAFERYDRSDRHDRPQREVRRDAAGRLVNVAPRAPRRAATLPTPQYGEDSGVGVGDGSVEAYYAARRPQPQPQIIDLRPGRQDNGRSAETASVVSSSAASYVVPEPYTAEIFRLPSADRDRERRRERHGSIDGYDYDNNYDRDHDHDDDTRSVGGVSQQSYHTHRSHRPVPRDPEYYRGNEHYREHHRPRRQSLSYAPSSPASAAAARSIRPDESWAHPGYTRDAYDPSSTHHHHHRRPHPRRPHRRDSAREREIHSEKTTTTTRAPVPVVFPMATGRRIAAPVQSPLDMGAGQQVVALRGGSGSADEGLGLGLGEEGDEGAGYDLIEIDGGEKGVGGKDGWGKGDDGGLTAEGFDVVEVVEGEGKRRRRRRKERSEGRRASLW